MHKSVYSSGGSCRYTLINRLASRVFWRTKKSLACARKRNIIYQLHSQELGHYTDCPDLILVWGRRNSLTLTYLLTYLHTPWSRVLLEKLTGSQLVKKFPAFYGTRRFITAFTSARHLSLSWASSIQSIHRHSTSWRSILIFSPIYAYVF